MVHLHSSQLLPPVDHPGTSRPLPPSRHRLASLVALRLDRTKRNGKVRWTCGSQLTVIDTGEVRAEFICI